MAAAARMETFGKWCRRAAGNGQNADPPPDPRMQSLKALFVLVAATTLAACGGGGDGASTPAPAPPPAPAPGPPVGTNGTLQTSVAAATYADARRRDAFDQLNAVRLGAGAGLLAQSAALDTSASAHAAYLSLDGFDTADSAHDEVAAEPGFYASNPFLRMQKAGYDYSYATEVIGDIGSTSATSDCVGDLLDTVYHAASMLSRVTDVGFGFGTGAAAGMCTIDMASPLAGGAARQIPPSGAVVAYPYDGSTVAHGTFHVSSETPRVSTTLLPGANAGTPVLVGFRNQDVVAGGTVTITQLSLATVGGTAVPAVIVAAPGIAGADVNTDAELDSAFAVLVPRDPLAAGTYRVTLQASISGGRALNLTSWSFTVASP